MPVSIDLKREVQANDPTIMGGFRMKVTAFNGQNIPNAIFLYRRRESEPGVYSDEFFTVASHYDLYTYPENSPAPNQDKPYFRLDYVDLIFADPEQADSAWEAIKTAVQDLVNGVNATLNLLEHETITITSTN